MIYLEMYGRLGNQFFRYAAARALQLKFYPDEKLVINFQQVYDAAQVDASFYDVLQDYNVAPYTHYSRNGKAIFNESNLAQKIVCIPYYIGMQRLKTENMNSVVSYENFWHKKLCDYGLYWFRRGEWNLIKSKQNNKFLSGNFESPNYFNAIRDVLIKEFTPKYAPLEKNHELYEKIKSTNSVCISVRRGDFETNEMYRGLHSVCHQEYFMKAIDRIKGLLVNPTFFFFSDDVEWVKANIRTGCETYSEDGTDPVWEKLRMMSMCKHFIISNSTFSWWAQYLCTNEEKIVISPSRWFNNEFKSPLIEEWFIKIEV